uniref:Uncharacterized protein n=1 Tax=Tetradesmus obliquus TaxID=3088 RepID=A0A383VD41_TETOB|eukprot:jgi/Sobl393_1/15475/SZX63478.1
MALASCSFTSITVSVGALELMQRQTRCWEIACIMHWQEACMGRQGTQEAISWQVAWLVHFLGWRQLLHV